MKLQHVTGATVVVFALGMVTVGPAYAQRRDGNLLPQEQGGQVTAVGCLVRGTAVRGGKDHKYVLARPKKGPVASVPEATCTTDQGADALDLDKEGKAGLTEALLGRWIEVSGRLEKETSKDPDNLRELDVSSFRIVPVVPPRPASTASSSAQSSQQVARAQAPEATAAPSASASSTEARSLPHTASRVPAIGLAGLLLLAAGLFLRSFRLGQQG